MKLRPDQMPENASIEAFVEYLMDDGRAWYSAPELRDLAAALRLPTVNVRRELDGYGAVLRGAPKRAAVRGFRSVDENRWHDSGNAGGSGWSNIFGMAGNAAQ